MIFSCRKLKNRVAAQLARDRKKQRMSELEEALTELAAENKLLTDENDALRLQSGELEEENDVLRSRLGLTGDVEVNLEKKPVLPAESAALAPQQQETIQAFFLTSHYLSMILTFRYVHIHVRHIIQPM